eukprot:12337-Heterococcus_DN1.PRE.1
MHLAQLQNYVHLAFEFSKYTLGVSVAAVTLAATSWLTGSHKKKSILEVVAAEPNGEREAAAAVHMLGYVGTRSHLYSGAVSSFWKQCYESATNAEEKRRAEGSKWHRRTEISIPRKTNYSVAFQSVAMLSWAHASGLQLQADNQTLQYAAGEQASLLVLDALHGLGLAFDEHTLDGAVASEREDIVDFLYIKYDCPLAWYIGLAPARSGNISMLRSLRQLGYQFGHFAMCSDAALGGHLEALKYLRSEECSWFAPSIAGHAASSGNLEMVQWVLQHEGVVLDASTMAGAAEGGSIAICEYLLTKQCPIDATACTAAVSGRHEAALRWLYKHECPMDATACTAAVRDAITFQEAAEQKQLDALHFLHERGCPWETGACTAASRGGFVDALRFLHEQNCPWDAEAPAAAARNGHLNAVRYLHEQGCPWDATA